MTDYGTFSWVPPFLFNLRPARGQYGTFMDISFTPKAFCTSRFGLQAEWAEHVCSAPQSHICSAPQLNVNLFSNRQGIIYVNAEVSNGALDFSVTKKKLDRT